MFHYFWNFLQGHFCYSPGSHICIKKILICHSPQGFFWGFLFPSKYSCFFMFFCFLKTVQSFHIKFGTDVLFILWQSQDLKNYGACDLDLLWVRVRVFYSVSFFEKHLTVQLFSLWSFSMVSALDKASKTCPFLLRANLGYFAYILGKVSLFF